MPGNTIQQTAAATAGVGEPSANTALTCHFELPGAQDVMPTDEKDATDASDEDALPKLYAGASAAQEGQPGVDCAIRHPLAVPPQTWSSGPFVLGQP